MDDLISRQAVLDGIEELKKSPWATDKRGNGFEYLIKEALEVVADLCVKQLPSVIPKQNDILDKIRAEIETQEKWLVQVGYNAYNVDIAFSSIKSVLAGSED